jgi:hypothetical protein
MNKNVYEPKTKTTGIPAVLIDITHITKTLVPSAEYWAEAPFNGGPLWQPGDPVHLVARAYDELAAKVAEVLLDVSDEADLEPVAKSQ